MAATALGAARAVVCIDRRDRDAIASARTALDERRRLDPVVIERRRGAFEVRRWAQAGRLWSPWLNGGNQAKPGFAPPRPSDRGVGGAPTLVDNVETLANIALIARFGADEYRLAGEIDEPGSMLVTLRGRVARPGVYETEIGTPLAQILDGAGAGQAAGVLIGGYFGTWLAPPEVAQARMTRRGLRPFGASPGCGFGRGRPRRPLPPQRGGIPGKLPWLAANSGGSVRRLRQRSACSCRSIPGRGGRRPRRRRDSPAGPLDPHDGGAGGVQATGRGGAFSRQRPSGLRGPHRRASPKRPVPTQSELPTSPTPNLGDWR